MIYAVLTPRCAGTDPEDGFVGLSKGQFTDAAGVVHSGISIVIVATKYANKRTPQRTFQTLNPNPKP